MCGRFANAATADQLKTSFKVQFPEAAGHNRQPRWNIPPGTDIETIVLDGNDERQIAMARWGIEPDWSKRPLINAKGETMFEKRTFSDAASRRRCVVVASGWYEWKAPKHPYHFRYRDGAPMALGGLFWLKGESMNAVIVTRRAIGELADIHHRAPLLLEGEDLEHWLDPSTPLPIVEDIVRDADGEELEFYPVSPEVGSVSQNHEGLVKKAL